MPQAVESRIREKLNKGELVKVFVAGHLASPLLVDIVALHGGYDAIWLDQEHAGISLESAANTARAARAAGMDTFVRLAATDYGTVMRYLEYTAGGILAAAVNTAAQAEQIVQWARFGPRGMRGIYHGNVDGNYGMIPLADYTRHCGSEVFVGVQIESAEAVENVAAIARVPDIDLLFVGPVDLSQSLGVTGQFEHPKCLAAIDRVAQECAKAGRAWGILAPNADYARRMVERGCRLLALGSDIAVVHRGIDATKAMFAEWLQTPAEPLKKPVSS